MCKFLWRGSSLFAQSADLSSPNQSANLCASQSAVWCYKGAEQTLDRIGQLQGLPVSGTLSPGRDLGGRIKKTGRPEEKVLD